MFEFSLATQIPPHQVYQLHQLVMDVMCAGGHGLNNETVRPLWRSIAQGENTVLLVRSSLKPLGQVNSIQSPPVTMAEGTVRKFHCRLSLSKRVSNPNNPRSKSREVAIAPHDSEEWLRKLLHRHGFELQNAAVVSHFVIKVKRNHHINGADIIFHARVVDSAAAEKAWSKGLGRKKTFGFGLMLEAD